MKKILLLFAMHAVCLHIANAQNVAINQNGATAHQHAALDISADDKGVLIPRITTITREAILNPPEGLLVYDTNARSFWYYSGGWQELVGSGNMGTAGGDLIGQYPDPLVVKLQGHPVDALTPANGHVLKWDENDYMWKGMPDNGLTLPYTATAADGASLFSITNTFNGFSHNSSILGRRLAGSGIPMTFSTAVWGDAYIGTGILGTSHWHAGVHGLSTLSHGVHGRTDGGNGYAGVYGTQGPTGITPNVKLGVWGDDKNGIGVLGTSDSGVAVYGLSNSGTGVYGYSSADGIAGIKGSHGVAGGIGVMGEIGLPGLGIYGKANGTEGTAGKFENTHPESTHMALDARNLGMGAAATFWTSNAQNPSPSVLIASHSSGHGLFALHDSVGNNNSAIRAWHLGNGEGLYGKSQKGNAGKLVIDNILSSGHALHASTIGMGSAGVFVKTHLLGENDNNPAVLIDNYSKAIGLKVKSMYPSALTAALDVEYAGYSYAADITSQSGGLRSVMNHADRYAVFGQNGAEHGTAIRGYVTAFGAKAIEATATGPFTKGVHAITTQDWSVAVQGESASSYRGAVVGINSGGGPGLLGRNIASFGYGVYGESGPEHGIAGKFESSNPESTISPAIWAHVPSLSDGIQITLTNDNNESDGLYVAHDGSGNLLRLRNANYEEITLANNGDFTTVGAIKVKGNKGIVRNTGSAQKRMETTTVQLGYNNMPVGAMTSQTVTFSQAFGAAPIVTLGHINSGFSGPCEKMTVQIKNVTTTGCTVTMYNANAGGNPDVSGTWNLLIIGNE